DAGDDDASDPGSAYLEEEERALPAALEPSALEVEALDAVDPAGEEAAGQDAGEDAGEEANSEVAPTGATGEKAARPTKDPYAGASADELLAEARKASLGGDTKLAYTLAERSYQAKASEDAALLMGITSCKRDDARRAKKAYAKLSSKRAELEKLC